MAALSHRTADERTALCSTEAGRLLAIDLTLAIEFLMTAQRALLRGHMQDAREVTEPLKWAQGALEAVAKRA